MTTNSISARKTSARAPREDGEATRAKIIDVAGMLFAEKGYAETTNREISEVSGTNVTGINYHFGSREGLYEAVVREVSAHMLDPVFLARLEDEHLTAREKLEIVIDYKTKLKKDNWQLRLWAREMVAPSSIWLKMVNESAISKIEIVNRSLSAYTGIPTGEPELELCLLNVMSPIISLLMISTKIQQRRLPILDAEPEKVTDSISKFLFAGIDKIAEDYHARKGSMNHTGLKN